MVGAHRAFGAHLVFWTKSVIKPSIHFSDSSGAETIGTLTGQSLAALGLKIQAMWSEDINDDVYGRKLYWKLSINIIYYIFIIYKKYGDRKMANHFKICNPKTERNGTKKEQE